MESDSFLKNEKFDLIFSLNFIKNLYLQLNNQIRSLDLKKYNLIEEDEKKEKKHIFMHEAGHCIALMNPDLFEDILKKDISEKVSINTNFIGDYYLPNIFNITTSIFASTIYAIFLYYNIMFESSDASMIIFAIKSTLAGFVYSSFILTTILFNFQKNAGYIFFNSPIFNQIKKNDIRLLFAAGASISFPIIAEYIDDTVLLEVLMNLSGGCIGYFFDSIKYKNIENKFGMGNDLENIYNRLNPLFFEKISNFKKLKIDENESLIDFLKKTEDKSNLILLSIEANQEENKSIINKDIFLLKIQETLKYFVYSNIINNKENLIPFLYNSSISETKKDVLLREYSELLGNLVAFLAYKLIEKYKDPKFQEILNNMFEDEFIQKSSYLNMIYVDKLFNENYKKVYGYELKKNEKLKNISQKAIDAMDFAFYKSIITKDMIKNVPDLWETILLHLENENRPEEFKAKIKNLYEKAIK
jgi:hypothetical protein